MNTKILAVVLGLLMVVAFSGCIGSNEVADSTNGNISNTGNADNIGPEVTEPIASELMNETDSVEIGEMI